MSLMMIGMGGDRLGGPNVQDQVDKEKPSFGVIVIYPPQVFGPYFGDVKNVKYLNDLTYALFLVISKIEIPPLNFGGFCDAYILAKVYITGFKKEGVDSQRFLTGQYFNYQSVINIVRAAVLELKDKLPIGTPGKIQDIYLVNGSKAEKVLGIKYISLTQLIKNLYMQFIEARVV